MEEAKSNELNASKYYLKAVIDRFEGTMAVLKFDDGQTLTWPIKNLPEDCKEGSSLRVIISTSETDQEEREKLAKTLINEILKADT